MRSHRKTKRPRRGASSVSLLLLRPLFRRCWTRDAWILRGIGDRYGPVLVRKDQVPTGEHVPERSGEPTREQGRFARPDEPAEPGDQREDSLEPHTLRSSD